MADTDGKIQLSVDLSPDNVKNSAQKLQKTVQKIFDVSKGDKLTPQLQKIQNSMSKTASESRRVIQELDKLNSKKIAYEDYKLTAAAVSTYRQKLLEALDARKRLADAHTSINSPEWKEAEQQIESVKKVYDALVKDMQAAEEAGSNVFAAEDQSNLESYTQRLEELNSTQRRNISAFEELSGKGDEFEDVGDGVSRVERRLQSLADLGEKGITMFGKLSNAGLRLVGLGPVIDSVKNKISQFINRLKGGSGAANSFGNSLGTVFKKFAGYAIGIGSLTMLFNKLRQAIKAGLNDMAQLNGGVNQTNAALSSLQSSLNYLRGSFTAAFTPILTYIMPALSSFIDRIAEVINAIGMMIAKLTGAKSYFRATKTSTNYAASLGGGGGSNKQTAEEKYQEAVEKAQKKYDKQMAAYQEKYDKQVATAAAKNAEAQAKAEEKQAKAAAKLAKQQEKANRQLAAFDDLNVLNIEDLEELEEIEAQVYDEPEWDPPELELPDREDFEDALGGGGGGDPFGLEEVAIEDFDWDWDWLKEKAEELGRGLADNLNNIFANEDLAKSIGHNIAEALNTALHFAFGFIDEFDWRQMGRWLGTLIQEGIETFEWDLLGKTIGEFLNGVADSIIGFFETYQVGTLGESIATMFNNAIDTIDPELLGEAVADVLKAPFIELSHFFTATNWKKLGKKFTEFFHNALTNESLDGNRLGETVGQALADAVNAGIDLLLGADVKQAVSDLTTFLGDIFRTALMEIEWGDLFKAVWATIIGSLTGFLEGFTLFIVDSIIDMLEKAHPVMTGKLEKIRADTHAELEAAFDDAEAFFTGVSRVAEEEGDRFDQAIANMIDYMTDWSSGAAVDWTQALMHIQEQFGYTDEDMDELIGKFAALDSEFNDSAEILDGYTGSWEDYRRSLEETKPHIDIATEKQADLKESIEEVGNTAKDTSGEVKNYVEIASSEMEAGTQNAKDYETKTVESLKGITEAGDEVVVSFESLEAQVGAELESLTTSIDTWYQTMITTYFGYDAWYAMLQEGILTAVTTFFTTDFTISWDTFLQEWWDAHVIPWFDPAKWDETLFEPLFVFIQDKWKKVDTWWKDTAIKTWFDNLKKWWKDDLIKWFDDSVEDWYKSLQKKWESFTRKVEDALEEFLKKLKDLYGDIEEATDHTFSVVEDTIVEKINSAKEAVASACEEMLQKIEEVLEAMKELEEGGGIAGIAGAAGGVTGGGTRSATGGTGRTRGFMPALDIMHFEDNLGMSAFKFPELATGAVIPPNNKFLAVLGDQKSGTNIETPLATMIQAFRAAMSEYNPTQQQNAVMEVDGETFARLMLPYVMNEMKRSGYNTEIIEGV